MAQLLRKAWLAVMAGGRFPPPDPAASSPSSSLPPPLSPSSLGTLDCLPNDVLLQVLRMMGPREVARSSLVCRAWRRLAADSRLWAGFLRDGPESWDFVMFAETHLRSGPPPKFRAYYSGELQLTFMQIYACRAVVPGSVIIDGGSGYSKYGWSKYGSPSGRCATFLEFGNIESPLYARLRFFFSTIFTRMQVKSLSHPVTFVLPICHSDDTESAKASRKQYKETVYSVLFDMNVPAVCLIDQAISALYAAKRMSGIVVNIGFNTTTIVPIFRGKVMREIGVEVLGQGALKVTGFLRDSMLRNNIPFMSLYTVKAIKEKLCYVALDYEAELRKQTQASCEVPGEGLFTLSKERFQSPEILFQPHLGGTRGMGLHQAVSLCMHHCHDAELVSDSSWYRTVILAGGTACLPGLPERLERELHKNLPPSISEGIKVHPPPYGTDSSWFGAKILSNVSTFPDSWCMTKKQFRRKSGRSLTSFVHT